jgi:hypothetical protein
MTVSGQWLSKHIPTATNAHTVRSQLLSHLMKTQQAGKGLAGAVVICELWSLVVVL